ncbi:glycosyl hydrolase family 16 [Pseudonocardia hierapolitana]|uniref:Glycosyl hydrolase family 16 n=1 Tax=Pseudonocardia hierapolitana TaxID=1128676 RepID=A0A561T1W0_9PSEU|nr:glycoside hydrolase family 16 protein [Pseudonocardia hierapolitana]TWF81100.1 glycosyl hydrolase family 16 [Pseudonocardia hierapolitana]
MTRTHLDERFPGHDLDRSVWFPYYLPHWSSRAESAATWEVRDSALHLTIPPDQPLWCPDLHPEPLRVSCVQTGSLTGQQPFADGLVVREEQPTFWGYTPCYGAVEVRMRATVSPRSMFAFWMSGIEDEPRRSGEICVAEVFGDTVDGEGAAVGIGLHRFRDPELVEEFSAERFDLDVSEFHRYGVDWRPDGLTFSIDGTVVRRVRQSPSYPMQLMIGVFDFPAKATGADEPVPELVVSHVTGRP